MLVKLVALISLLDQTVGLRLRHVTNDDTSKHGQLNHTQASLISQFLSGSAKLADVEKAIDAQVARMHWTDAIRAGLKLPAEVVGILESLDEKKKKKKNKKETKKAPYSEAEIAQARATLNGMIESSRIEYDIEFQKCAQYEAMSQGTLTTIMSDLSRLGNAVAGDNSVILEAKGKATEIASGIDEKRREIEEHNLQCSEARMGNEAQLEILKRDATVAKFIVDLTSCTRMEGQVLMQGIVDCKAGGDVSLIFNDTRLAEAAGRLSSLQARTALQDALLNSHNSSVNRAAHVAKLKAAQAAVAALVMSYRTDKRGPFDMEPEQSAPVLPAAEPTTQAPVDEEDSEVKCIMGNADCGVLNDNMALMWGEVQDSISELEAIMATHLTECLAIEARLNAEIQSMQTNAGVKAVELTRATSALNADTQEQTGRGEDKLALEKERAEMVEECTNTLHEILFTQICGLKTVRAELSQYSVIVKPLDIHDCEVADWIEEECSKTCAGGFQNLTRIVVQETSYGAGCPPTTMTRPCNEFPCPIDCEMGEWSEFGKCSKECGGGIQVRSRNIKQRALHGGAACGASQETQSCNVQSCDIDCVLKDWSDWGQCSRACDGGVQHRVKDIETDIVGKGICADPKGPERLESQPCNEGVCPVSPKCIANLDLVILADVSGALKQSGFDRLKTLYQQLVDLYMPEDSNSVRIGVIEYSDTARIVSPLESDRIKVQQALTRLSFQRGVTRMGEAMTLSKTVLQEGRPEAQTVVLVFTDGKPTFKYSSRVAAKGLKAAGARVVMVPIYEIGDMSFMDDLASEGRQDVLDIKGLDYLEENMDMEVKRLLTSTCPLIQEPPTTPPPGLMTGLPFEPPAPSPGDETSPAP